MSYQPIPESVPALSPVADSNGFEDVLDYEEVYSAPKHDIVISEVLKGYKEPQVREHEMVTAPSFTPFSRHYASLDCS